MNTFFGLLILARCTDAWRAQSSDQAKAWLENFVALQREKLMTTGIVWDSFVPDQFGGTIAMLWAMTDENAVPVMTEFLRSEIVTSMFEIFHVQPGIGLGDQNQIWKPFFEARDWKKG